MDKTTKLVSLFAATVLVASTLAGCGDGDDEVAQEQAICYDDNDDGHCDDSGNEVDRSFGFIYIGGHKQYYKKGYYPANGKIYRSSKSSNTSSSNSSGTSTDSGKNGTGSAQPPKSSSGTGTVVSPGTSSNSGKSTSGANTGVSSGSKGGIGSSSKSSSS
ncbi:hypothetical protein CIG75_01315 [Tumebacillus algifaecis]|uniref:Lipoprotein n=1 Tax=Tumebacillus algifaecis TaxID=1214604 RepID=A0A223CX51_9BACL|nr:hypothetical protein [Tumebacillus algifaecis]ASS73744.1 hypothetical protein CIG75_01315 [Tumebacillus algifaecis]